MMGQHLLILRTPIGCGGLERRILDWCSCVDTSKTQVSIMVPKGSKEFFDVTKWPQYRDVIRRITILDALSPTVYKNPVRNFLNTLRCFRSIDPPPTKVIITLGGFHDFDIGTYFSALLFVGKENLYTTIHHNVPPFPECFGGKYLGLIPRLGLWRVFEYFLFGLRFKLCKKVYCCSSFCCENLHSWIGEMEHSILYHGISFFSIPTENKVALRKEYNYPLDKKIIISTSRLVSQKRIDLLVATFIEKKLYNKNYILLIVGDGPEESNLKRLAGSHVGKTIFFLGHRADVYELLKLSDIYVLLNSKESFGISTIEAMACGLICIVAGKGGQAEIIKDGESGFLVDPPDRWGDVVESLERMDKDRIESIVSNARVAVENRFNLFKNVSSFLEELGIPYVCQK